MKIIQLIYSLRSGGAEKFVVNLSNQLATEGHDVTICMLLDETNPNWIFNKQFIHPKVKLKSFGFSEGFSLKKMTTICKYLKLNSPDIVHCHLNVMPYIFPLAFSNKKITFIHTIHSIAEKASGLRIQRNINRFFYKTNRIIPITISKECKQSFENYYDLPNTVRIDNGCPAIKPSKYFTDVQNEIQKFKHTKNTKIFIHIARCHPAKNQELLINAFNKLYADNVDFSLIIVGAGYNSKEGIKLQQIANPHIYFLGEKNNVGDYLLCADAFCLSSIYEGLPISLIEAMSCGVTPICTAVGGIPDVITDKKHGYLSYGFSTDNYCTAIKQYLANPINKHLLSEYFNSNFSIEVCATQYVKVFNKQK